MCGFACVLNGTPLDAVAVESILAARGPDGRGELCNEHGWFLHRRLSIIDPTDDSAQPFLNAPPGATALYNGELYNYQELRAHMADLSTGGDTEVFSLLLANSNLAPARGMYAGLCSVDGDTHVARDRFGIKPLYLAEKDGSIAFASQLRCFPDLVGPCEIDPDAIASFLRFGAVVGTTMLKGVREFPAGIAARYRDGSIFDECQLPSPTPVDLGQALRNSVRRHLVADVPVAVLLSGGLDSAVLAKLAAEAGNDATAITLSPGGELDEADRARRTAEHYGLNHIVEQVELAGIGPVIDDFFDAMDQPSIDGLNTFLVSRAVRDAGFKVALSGLGADELFGGYSSFRRIYVTHMLRSAPTAVLASAINRSGANSAKLGRWLDARNSLGALATISREVFSPDEVERLCGSTFDPPPVDGVLFDSVVDTEVRRYMTPMLLRDADAYSMAHSVELRVPFLDDEVVGAAGDRSTTMRAFAGKSTIAFALRDRYLTKVALERKTGFRLPFSDWLKGELRPRLEAALSAGSRLSEVVDVSDARALIHTGPWSRKWALVALEEWLQRNG